MNRRLVVWFIASGVMGAALPYMRTNPIGFWVPMILFNLTCTYLYSSGEK